MRRTSAARSSSRTSRRPRTSRSTLEFRTHLPAGTHLIRIVNAVPGPNPEERAIAAAEYQALLHDEGAAALADQADRRRLQADLADAPARLGRVGRPGAGVLAAARAPAHLLRRRDARPRTSPMPARSCRGSPRGPIAARSGRRKWTGWSSSFEQSQKLGDNFEASVKTACSRSSARRASSTWSKDRPTRRRRSLNDWELASRLSYFLWSTMPDERLSDLAGQGTLHEPRRCAAKSAG